MKKGRNLAGCRGSLVLAGNHAGGYWSWSYRISDDAWLVRLSRTPASKQENPLIKEYKRTFEPEHRLWRKLAPYLLEGKVITLPTKEEATRFAISVRYHLRKEELP